MIRSLPLLVLDPLIRARMRLASLVIRNSISRISIALSSFSSIISYVSTLRRFLRLDSSAALFLYCLKLLFKMYINKNLLSLFLASRCIPHIALSADFLRHCILSGGTLRRSLPLHSSNSNINKKQLIPSCGNRTHNVVFIATRLCQRTTTASLYYNNAKNHTI